MIQFHRSRIAVRCSLALTATALVAAPGAASGAHLAAMRSPYALQVRVVGFIPSPGKTTFGYPVYLANAGLVAFVRFPPLSSFSRWGIWAIKADGTGLRRLALCHGHCSKYAFDCPTALPDGRLGFVRTRYGVNVSKGAATFHAYDPRSGKVMQLVPYGLDFGTRCFSFRPRMRDGLVNDGHGLYEQLVSLGPRRAAPFRLPLTRAGAPVWSPDGRLLALDGAPSSEHASDLGRVDLRYDLYLMKAGTHQLRPVVRGLTDASRSSWSPDGRWLALSMRLRGGPRGLYLVDTKAERLYLAWRRWQPFEAAWLPDGRSLVVALGDTVPGGKPSAHRGLAVLRVLNLPMH